MHFKALCNRKGIALLRLFAAASLGQGHFRLFNQTLRVMKLTAIILLVSVLHVSATGRSQTVTLKVRNASLENLFDNVTTQTGYYFFYRPGQLKGSKPVTINAEQLPLEAFLQQVFRDQPVTYMVQNQTIFIVTKTDTAQHKKPAAPPLTVQGEVRDSLGNLLRGATVTLVPGNALAITDKKGVFVLHDIAPGRYVLRVSYVGFETTSIPVNATENMAPVSVVLKLESANLVEVTVLNNGYQTLSRDRSAGSFSKPKMDVIYNRSTSMDLMQRLDGQLPGLVINNSPNQNGNTITVRGNSTIFADKSLLYVVDGVVVTDLADLNPNDVQDVTLLKDATAASIWGSRASNGVIVVVTKKGSFGANKLKVEYNGFVNFQGKPDVEYLPYMRSAEYIQTMKELFADPAYLTANTYASANMLISGNAAIAPHETILFKQYRGLISEATANAQLDSLAALDNLSQIKDIWYRNASLSNHTVSVRGGFGNYSLYGSLAYTNTTSSTPGEKNNAYKINLRQDVNVSKRVSVYLITNLVNTITSAGRMPNLGVTSRFFPYQLFKDVDGNSISMPWLYRTDSLTTLYQAKSGVNLNYNPIDEMNYGNTKGNNFNANITGGITVKLIKGLRVEGVYGVMNGNSKTTDFESQKSFTVRNQLAAFTVPATTPGGSPTYYLPTTGGKLTTTNVTRRNYTIRHQLVYDITSGNGDHQLTTLAGQEATSAFGNTNISVARGYDPELNTSLPIDYVTLANGISGTVFPSGLTRSSLGYDAYSETENLARTTSWYSNAAYTYLRRYTINASVRNDKSNLFGQDRSVQYKPLWSIGLSWQINRESFMEHVMWVDYLTLRATYGLSGNQPSKSGYFAAAYDILSGGTNINVPGGIAYSIGTYGNKRISWENTRNYNVGLDYSFLKGRLLGNADLYMRRTTNLIGYVPANAFAGVTSFVGNLGDMHNTGVETRLTSVNFRKRDFIWSTTLILSYNVNKVTKLYTPNPTTSAIQYMSTRYAEGYSSYAQWGYRFKGLDNVGDPLVELADGTITKKPGVALASDLVYMGTWQPTLTGGFSNNFRYRNFQLSCNMVYNFGSRLKRDALGLNTTTSALAGRTSTSAGYFFGNMYRDFNSRWKKTGDETITNIPAYIPSSSISSSQRSVLYYANGDINYFDGAYIKMRDINLSYTLPQQIVSRMRAEEITFRATLSNVLLWKANQYGIDPEFHNSTTAERTIPFAQHSIAFGLNLRF
ncbi:SusC/RagA family TonB-linked outer membrane protein [Niastella caeni]|uniref:SusC/RagA family TonB-linked outer membrane protein n=1 Tax=Niastella caeni TaxID=2569763 RepID=A0A4S8HW53_9BACT|nr:SusC/RagA family TonB-linked outer membrane protein [Niastella caeni]THU39860.1 SusC/RagA family TonB-linked outer membrane protein [Niastella caeni]